MMQIELAATYAYHGFDEHLDTAMKDARERMRAALGFTATLMRERKESALTADAAVEFRDERRSRA